MKTSGPRVASRSTTTVEAGRTGVSGATRRETLLHERQRSTGNFPVIQAGGAIQFFDTGRKGRADAPLVRPGTRRPERVFPIGPPRRHESSQRLHDEKGPSPTCVRLQLREQLLAALRT